MFEREKGLIGKQQQRRFLSRDRIVGIFEK